MSDRTDRPRDETRSNDQREPFQVDRDRILYCSASRRLAGVTQVVGAAEGHLFHNRLTHSVKVSQIARRLAEYLLDHDDAEQKALAQDLEISPDVAEAAGLAHDIGHPPFGHIGENELHRCACEAINDSAFDGFQGNAQTFRIVNRVAVHRINVDGLNLTRATLNALLKYPWYRDSAHPVRNTKWSVYREDWEAFEFARAAMDRPDELRSPEAEIMDWADDIAYSVHDVEDFYRAGLLPLGEIAKLGPETVRLCGQLASSIRARDEKEPEELALDAVRGIISHVREELHVPYVGSRRQRGALRYLTSLLVGQLLRSFRLKRPDARQPGYVDTPPSSTESVVVLKGLMRQYVYNSPALAAQQEGQKKVLRDLFEILHDAASGKRNPDLLPRSTKDLLEVGEKGNGEDAEKLRVRAVTDSIASMTEQEAYGIHRRLTGVEVGRVGDPIVL